MKKEIKNILVVGGGAVGWLTASAIIKKHPDINVSLVESPKVPILGVGESTIPPLRNIFDWIGIDENKWLAQCHGLHKFGNQFVGWNSERPCPTVQDHWNASEEERIFYSFSYNTRSNSLRKSYMDGITPDDYYYNNDNRRGVNTKSHDYFLHMMLNGEYPLYKSLAGSAQDQYFPALNNRAARYDDGYPVIGHKYGHAWHIDAERLPGAVRDQVAIPSGVKHIVGHIENIKKDEDGYITELELEDKRKLKADLYVDCSGFTRLLTKTMGNQWVTFEGDQLPAHSAWVAPVKYNDPYKEMRPYTQSYAQKSGWNFIITLYSRMGSGYIFDRTEEDPDAARESFIKYWDSHELIREPRLIEWDQGYYSESWTKNVVGIGMTQGFVDPMEANSIFVAQTGMQLLDQALSKYKNRKIPDQTKKAFGRELKRIQNHIHDFIAFHFGLSKRQDTSFWRKVSANGIKYNHPQRNWNEYRRSNNNLGRNLYIDLQYSDQQIYFGHWDEEYCKLDIDEKMIPLAKSVYDYRQAKGKAIAQYAPNVYDWHRKHLHNGATHDEVLQQAQIDRIK